MKREISDLEQEVESLFDKGYTKSSIGVLKKEANSHQDGTAKIRKFVEEMDWQYDPEVVEAVNNMDLPLEEKSAIITEKIKKVFNDTHISAEDYNSTIFTIMDSDWDDKDIVIDYTEVYTFIEDKEREWKEDKEYREKQEAEKKLAVIVQLEDGKWQVQSEKGRNMGMYDTEEKAKKRLQQIEYFKHKDKKESRVDVQLGDEVELYNGKELHIIKIDNSTNRVQLEDSEWCDVDDIAYICRYDESKY